MDRLALRAARITYRGARRPIVQRGMSFLETTARLQAASRRRKPRRKSRAREKIIAMRFPTRPTRNYARRQTFRRRTRRQPAPDLLPVVGSGFVLLISCANVRRAFPRPAIRRHREIAVRLFARRGPAPLVRQFSSGSALSPPRRGGRWGPCLPHGPRRDPTTRGKQLPVGRHIGLDPACCFHCRRLRAFRVARRPRAGTAGLARRCADAPQGLGGGSSGARGTLFPAPR